MGVEGDPRPRRRYIRQGEKGRITKNGDHLRMNVTGMVCPRTGVCLLYTSRIWGWHHEVLDRWKLRGSSPPRRRVPRPAGGGDPLAHGMPRTRCVLPVEARRLSLIHI